ncbi:MAG: tRNA (adenosine(37)-N6)-threonylcarbamoyltransferase complex dimerization subunit type 1 TsaB [Pyrinomonadaceae bacterium]
MKGQSRITLAIESAIAGGSIAILSDGDELASWHGTSGAPRAEDLLVRIDEILAANDISVGDLDLVAATAGPGSFTGVRIGLATALGLTCGLGISMASETALKAMAFSRPELTDVTAVVPCGRNAVCLQRFHRKNGELLESAEPRNITETELTGLPAAHREQTFLVHSSLSSQLASSPNVIDFGQNIASALGRACQRMPLPHAKPLFISKAT